MTLGQPVDVVLHVLANGHGGPGHELSPLVLLLELGADLRELAALGIGDLWFVSLCCAVTIVVYAAVYFGVYSLTSYEYYRIVRRHAHAQ